MQFFFALHGTLINRAVLHPCYADGIGRVMSARYGHAPQRWIQAYQQISADWDSYHADLDFGADDGIDQFYESLYRVTRALFRLTHTPEPPVDALTALSRSLPALASEGCSAAYPDVLPVLERLYAAGHALSITAHSLSEQTRALLHASEILAYINGVIIGPDNAPAWEQDAMYYRHAAQLARTPITDCVLIDDQPAAIRAAREAGIHTVYVLRDHKQRGHFPAADVVLHGQLTGLLDHFGA